MRAWPSAPKTYLPTAIVAASSFGFPVVCGMVMFAGVCETIIGRLLGGLRKFFPAVVSGVVILAVGVELGKIGVGVLFGSALAHETHVAQMFVVALAVLAIMTGLAVWGSGLPKLLCVLIGILAGYALAAALHVFPADFGAELARSPFFALPNPSFVSWAFEPSLMLPFAIAGLASGLRVVGVLTTCQQINDSAWRRPDMKSIAGGVVADGIGCAIGGAVGTPGMSASPSLVGIEKTTGVTSRVVVWSIAGWLVVLACLPQFASLIVNMPKPVMAAALIFNGALMFVAGIEIVMSRPITLRAALTVGLSVVASLSVPMFPEFYKSLPEWTRQFTASQITVAVLSSVALNAVFLLGTWRYAQLRLGGASTPLTPSTFDAFFEAQAAEWKIPASDAKRVRTVVDEAIERIAASATGPVEIRIGSDAFDITVTFVYSGDLPHLPDARPKRDLVEEQSFVSGLTGYLSGIHADRIEQSAHGDQCTVALLFRL